MTKKRKKKRKGKGKKGVDEIITIQKNEDPRPFKNENFNNTNTTFFFSVIKREENKKKVRLPSFSFLYPLCEKQGINVK